MRMRRSFWLYLAACTQVHLPRSGTINVTAQALESSNAYISLCLALERHALLQVDVRSQLILLRNIGKGGSSTSLRLPHHILQQQTMLQNCPSIHRRDITLTIPLHDRYMRTGTQEVFAGYCSSLEMGTTAIGSSLPIDPFKQSDTKGLANG